MGKADERAREAKSGDERSQRLCGSDRVDFSLDSRRCLHRG